MGRAENCNGERVQKRRGEETRERRREPMIVEQKKTAEIKVTHIKQTHAHRQKHTLYEHIPTNPDVLVFPSSAVVAVVQQ